MAFLADTSLNITSAISQLSNLPLPSSFSRLESSLGIRSGHSRKLFVTMSGASVQSVALSHSAVSKNVGIPVMVNGCTGKMGRAVLEAAISAGLDPVPVALGGPDDTGKIVDAGGKQIEVHGHADREKILASTFDDYPNLIVVDYTVPTAVNENAALYCKVGVPFVIGTTGGDRELLYKTVEDSKVYAVISPQMGKQVVAFLAAMKIMGEQFPGAFSGYKLEVMESHQASKLDISGTAKDVISCFQKLGVSYELDQVLQIRDPKLQTEMIGVPEEHLSGHAFHMYRLSSPDGTVSFEFQHNVCGRSIYAEGTVDAILFLAKKHTTTHLTSALSSLFRGVIGKILVKSNSDKRIFNMIDVLREGNMR